MDPFLKSPGRAPSDAQQHPPLHPHQDPETAYLQKDATIRKVISTEPGSPKARPTFFSESSRRGSDFGKAYPKESRPTTAQEAEDDLGPLEDIPSRIISRPQTSPHAPSGLLPPDSTEPPPIPIRYRRSYDTFKTETPHMLAERTSTWHSGRELRPPSEEVVKPILTAKELEVFQQQEMKRRASENLHSSLDVSAATISKSRDAETSWLATPTPLSAGTNTPTVTLQRDGEIAEPWGESDKESVSDVVVLDEHDDPTEAEEEIAKKIYDGDEMYVLKDRTPFLLTESGPSGVRLRRAYMSLYDWSNINILTALRQMCNRIVLKGETQEVDRIVDAISKRWCECNPNHGFKSADIIHTILYSLLLLNTDLHLAEIPSSQKMTRGQFIKNTMATIKKGLQDSSNEAIGNLAARPAHHSIPVRHGSFPEESPSASSNSVAPSPNAGSSSRLGERASIDYGTSRARNSSKASGIGNLSPRFAPEGWNEKNFIDDGGIALVNKPIGGGIRVWETQVEIILKDFYSSVKEHALPLHGAPIHYPEQSSSNLSVFGSGMLRRSPSTISKCPSEHSVGGRRMDAGRLGSGWAAKNRSRQRVYNGSRAGSSRTSLEERSIWSPGASSTWSKLSLDKTQASTLSVNSLGSAFANDDYKQSIGFANALSHAIIREEASGTGEDHSTIIEDEDLELAGPPWAKEGLVKHKHHLEGVDKKAKNRAWTECFAVIEKGYMRLFQFTPRSKQGIMASNSGVVGGGNWSENAEPIGTFLLRQTLASALPPPGYSKTRPHVWALSLPNGAVHLFQGGTSELVKEWVSTANYWSARLSKEPLVGGVSNMEYGWSDNILDASIPDTASAYGPRISLQESIRSSIDIASGPYVKARLPGDKANISDWQAPAQSMVASPLPESEQLQALQTYVSNIEAELQKHNDLRASMVAAFSPRHSNYQKALANWEKKSSYLLHEIVKFRTYIDALGTASVARERLRVEGEERDEMRRERERSKAAAASTAASGIGAL
ncbi:SEC7-like protein [Ascobolus immersus RN42]|uniref:SEC7-like protein n=1 Tax=Ascobolus immersus RN42 TaxID=1160509 RepID=A0A3N4I2A7_ASCIM|nr:SEC7-like protein [Ascobolus immersus RN42]